MFAGVWTVPVLLISALASRPICAQSCFNPIYLNPGIQGPHGGTVLFYRNHELAVYVTALLGRGLDETDPLRGVCVVPVYSRQRISFARGNWVFVSTGLLLTASGEREVLEALRAARRTLCTRRRQSGDYATFDPLPGASPAHGFEHIQAALRREVEEYEELVRPRLRLRYAVAAQPEE
jgi:hypothetical protein